MQQQHNKTSRRMVLKAALSLGIVLGTGALAQASNNPFVPGSHWSGSFVSTTTANSGKLTIDIDQGGAMVTVSIGSKQVGVQVQVTWSSVNPISGQVTIESLDPAITLHISGLVSQTPGGTYSLGLGSEYHFMNVAGIREDSGTITTLNLQSQGLVSAAEVDANIPSISIFPPDFLGVFESRSGFRGQLSFHREAAPTSALSNISGVLRYNDLTFNFTMTFAPKPNEDGSFTFDLVGGSPQGGVPVPLTGISGRFHPGDRSGALGTIKGTYQLIGARATTLDLGTFSLLQVP